MIAARLEAEIMAQPERERLDYAIGLLAFYLDPPAAFMSSIAAQGLRISAAEARILHALDRRRGRIVTLQSLHAAAMGDRPAADWSDPGTVYARISTLRKAIARAGLPAVISAWSGVGYRLTAPDGFSFGGDDAE
ncbi:helix-turn-helix domain-containing protein [Chachezhania antarctica]|uniref:helix-turn-helix domain-containing protein n=1 Tax=Chachezhania antarctica TaxID=2340860 RepID=UPI000EB47908|nr:helix-turn-helix domain-containing protein [Chachezhania antarctica]|tara:strand:+ start:6632 stop:7036 length:405 start_codon:yes stop_codon:yes gene_type:complete